MNGRTLTSLVAVMVASGVYAAGCSSGGGGGSGSTYGGVTPTASGTLTEGLPVVQRDPAGYGFNTVSINTIKGGQVSALAAAPVNTAVFVGDQPGGNVRLVDDQQVTLSGNLFYEAHSMAAIGTRVFAGTSNPTRGGAGDLYEYVNQSWQLSLDTRDSEMVVGAVSSDAFIGSGATGIYAAHGGFGAEGALVRLDEGTGTWGQVASLHSATPTAIGGREGRLFVGASDNNGGYARLLRLDVNQAGALDLVDLQLPGAGGGLGAQQRVTALASISTVATGSIVPIVSEVLIVAVGSFDQATGAPLGGQLLATDGDQRFEVMTTFTNDAPTAIVFQDDTVFVATAAGKLQWRDATGAFIDEPLPAGVTGIGAAISRDPASMVLGCKTANGALLVRRIGQSGFTPTSTDRYYRPDVKALLQASCAACHGAPGLATARAVYAFDLTNDTADYNATKAKVSLTAPSSSLLLVKATGGANHLGGALIQAGSPQYAMLLDWISQGARFEQTQAPPPPAKKTFAGDVQPIFVRLGCAACHMTAGAGGAFTFKGTTAQLAADYAETMQEVNSTTPELSDILRKPAQNGVTHTGGRLMPLGSADYNTVLQWIKDGAPMQ
jgi:hypothetical protein